MEGLRVLIINTDYSGFLDCLYQENPGLAVQSYAEQLRVRAESLFGVADFYSANLRRLGHEAYDIYANNRVLQTAWAHEHGIPLRPPRVWGARARGLLARARQLAGETPVRILRPVFRSLRPWVGDQASWMYDVLGAQIKYYKPDVLLNQDVSLCGQFLRDHKPYVRLLVGQHASPIPQQDFGAYDLMISSLPNVVDYFRSSGLRSELHRFGFEPSVLQRLTGIPRCIPVSFVGSLSPSHASRCRWLEHVCERVPVEIWGQGPEGGTIPPSVGRSYRGAAWGLDMYRILSRSRITLNHHIDMAGPYANNMRLYEATGVGALLVTDWKVNLHTAFEPGREVVAYRDPQECVDLVRYYLEREAEREAIAAAGQERTLREHTYSRRMEELVDIVCSYL
jgi:hypothetical protein